MKHIGVTRYEHSGRKAWYARVYRGGDGTAAAQAFFYDDEHGGQRAAWKVACAWQETMDLAIPRTRKSWRQPGLRGSVWREKRQIWDPNREKWYLRDHYHALLARKGLKRLSASFSVLKWGEEEARRRAWVELRKWRRELKVAA